MIIIFGHISITTSANLEASLELGKNNAATSGITEIGGNAAIQAIAAARAGAKTSLCGTIGNDLFGETILKTLRREGINATSIAKHDYEKTGNITTITAQNTDPTTISIPAANTITHAAQIPNASLNQRTLLLLQTDLSPKINVDILKRAQSHDSKSILSITNTENINEELLALADLVIEKEEQNKKGYNAFCGTLAACLQAGINQEVAQNYAQTAGLLAAKKGAGYSALPYLDDIEKAL